MRLAPCALYANFNVIQKRKERVHLRTLCTLWVLFSESPRKDGKIDGDTVIRTLSTFAGKLLPYICTNSIQASSLCKPTVLLIIKVKCAHESTWQKRLNVYPLVGIIKTLLFNLSG